MKSSITMWPGVVFALLLFGMIGSLSMVWIALHNPPELIKVRPWKN